MDQIETDLLCRHPVPRHRLTRQDYHRLGEAGILGEDDRVELLEGQLVDMSPIGRRHAFAVDALTEALVLAATGRATVRVQNPIVLNDFSEPLPDFALLRRRGVDYLVDHPAPGDVFLVVEVAETSLCTDRGAKLELYARAGIAEVWIVDLTTDTVYVHRSPHGDRYESISRIGATGVLDIQALPGIALPVAPIFGR